MLEESISQCDQRRASKRELERIDIEITRVLSNARKKVEGWGKGVPCSREIFYVGLSQLTRNLEKKQAMGMTINEESMENNKRVVTIVNNANTTEETEVELEKAQVKWMSLKERRQQAINEYLLDF